MSFNFSLHFCPKFSLAFGGALQNNASAFSGTFSSNNYSWAFWCKK